MWPSPCFVCAAWSQENLSAKIQLVFSLTKQFHFTSSNCLWRKDSQIITSLVCLPQLYCVCLSRRSWSKGWLYLHIQLDNWKPENFSFFVSIIREVTNDEKGFVFMEHISTKCTLKTYSTLLNKWSTAIIILSDNRNRHNNFQDNHTGWLGIKH